MDYFDFKAIREWIDKGEHGNISISAAAIVLFLCLVIFVFGQPRCCQGTDGRNAYSTKVLDYDDDTDPETELETDMEMLPLQDERGDRRDR